MVKRTFHYSWSENVTQPIIQSYSPGLILDIVKSKGSILPLANEGILQAKQGCSMQDYFSLLTSDYQIEQSSIPLKGFCYVPKNMLLTYKEGSIIKILPYDSRMYVYSGFLGKEIFITDFGLRVHVGRMRKHLKIVYY